MCSSIFNFWLLIFVSYTMRNSNATYAAKFTLAANALYCVLVSKEKWIAAYSWRCSVAQWCACYDCHWCWLYMYHWNVLLCACELDGKRDNDQSVKISQGANYGKLQYIACYMSIWWVLIITYCYCYCYCCD